MKKLSDRKRSALTTEDRIFLGAPYSSDRPAVEQERIQVVNTVACGLLSQGYLVYSPLTFGHTLRQFGDLPGESQFWRRLNSAHLKTSDVLLVLRLPGWQDSIGLAEEIQEAKELEKRILYTYPDLRLFLNY